MLALFLRLLTFFLICSTSEDLKEIKATPGDNVVLQCQGTRDATIELLEWSRPDVKPGYVFYFRDKLIYEDFQHESFHGRVELRDPQMKDGDASVILKHVNNNDTGTYECRIILGNTRSIKTDGLEFTSRIILKVGNSGHTGGDVGLAVGLSVFGVFLLLLGGVLVIFRKQLKAIFFGSNF